jgi:hypothetical protein
MWVLKDELGEDITWRFSKHLQEKVNKLIVLAQGNFKRTDLFVVGV